jgi:hypothetical protein
MRPLQRVFLVLISAAVCSLLVPPTAGARVIHLKFPRMKVPPHTDREACNFVRLPRKTSLDIAGTVIVNKGAGDGFISHHFLMWAYQGTHADQFPAKSQIQNGEACLDFGPSDREQRLLIAGSQSVKSKQILPSGLAQKLDPVDDNGKSTLGIILDSHWINSSDRDRYARVDIAIFPSKGKVKRYIQPIFDIIANGFIKVPPDGTGMAPDPIGWGPGAFDVSGVATGGSGLAGGRIPAKDEPVCVIMLTSHMHKRGRLFTITLDDGHSTQELFRTTSYTDPGFKYFDGKPGDSPPLFMDSTMRLHYECMHENGATSATQVKLGCQEVIPTEGLACTSNAVCGKGGTCVQGACTNIPGRSVLETLPDFHGAAKRCTVATAATDCTPTDPNYPGRQFTGKCVPANLVFGFTSDDDMCIMPGAYYDANTSAPAGQECNLGLL